MRFFAKISMLLAASLLSTASQVDALALPRTKAPNFSNVNAVV